MTHTAVTSRRLSILLCAALVGPSVTHAAHHGMPGDVAHPPAVACTAESSAAERGKTTRPGSPGSQSGMLSTSDLDACEPTGAHHPAGKTTAPGSPGTQGGALPAAPTRPIAPPAREPR